MKKQVKIAFIILIPILCVAILAGTIAFYSNKDVIEGCFFKKMYGSIGITDDDNYAMAMVLYNFNSDVSFLDDKENIAFDNSNVKIEDISYKVQNVDGDLTVYDVTVNIEMKMVGQHDVTSLVYNGEEKEVFPIGEIHFFYQDNAIDFLQHGCNTNIINGEALFSFSAENTRGFTITNVIVADDERSKYTFEKDVHFTPGEELIYIINVNSSVSDHDLLVLQPIFEIQYDGSKEKQYFSPYMLEFKGNNMTYDEIKEYVK